jgi:Peptidase family M23
MRALTWRPMVAVLLVPGAFALPATARAQDPAPRPTADVLSPPAPVVRTDGRRHLVYELVVDNPTASSAELRGLDVLGPDGGSVATFGPDALAGMLAPFGTTLPAGGLAVVRLDVALPRGRVPGELSHRLAFALAGGAELTVSGAGTTVSRRAPVRVGPPLRGERLVAIIAHTPVTIDGRLSFSQRYAIDFVRLNEAGDDVFTGDPQRNDSYAIYGSEVIAVADGTIAVTRDGLAENTPPAEPPFTTFDVAAGNRVVQDLGGGRYALYAHLQPGSLRVAPGERVRRGQVLGAVGNTGISSGPHLHFQVMDGPGGASALDADGLPYVFHRFGLDGTITDFTAPVIVPAAPPREREDEFPLIGDVLEFG